MINRPVTYVKEVLEGRTLAHPEFVLDGEDRRVVRKRDGVRKGKVGIASSGGSDHLPFFTGYVGKG